MSFSDLLPLLGFIVACFAASAMGVIFPPGQWYERLKKPSWRPPNWLFAPVWSLLYLAMAVAGWLVWRKAGFAGAAVPFVFYFLQLALNAVWTPIFFGLRRPGAAFVTIVLLWVAIAVTIVLFYPVDVVAALLLVPYLAWVSFASALNFAIWRLNGPSPA